ncbi:MAG: ribose-5-phosphate isomerase RpiA [Methanobrevibacter sp. CfCl-M3]
MNLKKIVGFEAAKEVKDGDIVGLGTGSTMEYFIKKLGERIENEEIEIMGIPTSYQSFLLAKELNIPVTTLDEYDIDIAIDGADEIDKDLNLIKGGGGAHTLEKIVDYSAKVFIVIADESKLVENLGNSPVPLEIISESVKPVFSTLRDMGSEPIIRMAKHKVGPVISDNGNFIIDAKFPIVNNPVQLEKDLNSIPGVVENGIFSQMTDKAIIACENGLKKINF